ncbi:PRELI domain-containing protein 2-like [Diadema antillarum]|uniref:PRELI domain-containing protein 2-like n=1 Tax=Diadema antillarum TaxID=105358 RepID=UPI003A8B673F
MFEVVFNHVFKFPLDLVIHTHFNKYPNEKMDVVGVKIEEQHYDSHTAVHYWRRVMTCRNILPAIFKKFPILDVNAVLLEEECWYHKKEEVLRIKSRNVTWHEYAQAWEESELRRSKDSSQWTTMTQRGGLEIKVFGKFGRVVEYFLHGLAKRNGMRAIYHMEDLLSDKQRQPVKGPFIHLPL